jgi:hypothetical protein
MKLSIKLASAAGAVGLATVGGLAALGSSQAAAHPASARPAAVVRVASVSHLTKAAETGPATDPDNIQSGDQTTPDTPAAATATKTASVTQAPGDETPTPETGTSDGPGGHADSGTTVDHQFDGVE